MFLYLIKLEKFQNGTKMVRIRQFTEAAMQTLNQDIKDKTFRKVYLLFGDEPFLVNSYKKRLREAITGDDTMNYNYFEGKGPDVKEIISLADTMPFFAERRLVLIDGSGFFKSSAPEELVDYIPEIPESTCMVFVESEVDKRNKLYKKVKDNGYAAELKKQVRPANAVGRRNLSEGRKEDHAPDHGVFYGADRGRYGEYPDGAGEADLLYHGS